MSFELVAQEAIFNALDGNITGDVYDEPPALPVGMPDSGFPYTVIGDDTAVAFDTDDTLGKEITVTLHVWSRYNGSKEAKQILGEIYDLLNRTAPTITGYKVVDLLCEFTQVFRRDNGKLRQGVARYRMTIQKN